MFNMLKVLISAPPFVNNMKEFESQIRLEKIEVIWLQNEQFASESEILRFISDVDAWILGDDLCTAKILEQGSRGRLKALVKWGIGTDNIDFEAVDRYRIKFSNTPNMFGNEVADLAICYLIALARKIIPIHLSVKSGLWTKITGQSLYGKKLGIVGFGDIGRQIGIRAAAMGMDISVYEVENFNFSIRNDYSIKIWPENIDELDFLILSCSLTPSNFRMINSESLSQMKSELNLINVSRGGLVDTNALVQSLRQGSIQGAALDVFEVEPIEADHPLLKLENVILGSHNASNTIEAVRRTSLQTLEIVKKFCL